MYHSQYCFLCTTPNKCNNPTPHEICCTVTDWADWHGGHMLVKWLKTHRKPMQDNLTRFFTELFHETFSELLITWQVCRAFMFYFENYELITYACWNPRENAKPTIKPRQGFNCSSNPCVGLLYKTNTHTVPTETQGKRKIHNKPRFITSCSCIVFRVKHACPEKLSSYQGSKKVP